VRSAIGIESEDIRVRLKLSSSLYKLEDDVLMNICPVLLNAMPTKVVVDGVIGITSSTVMLATVVVGKGRSNLNSPYFVALEGINQRLPYPSIAPSPE
jgi:hypothetical protein